MLSISKSTTFTKSLETVICKKGQRISPSLAIKYKQQQWILFREAIETSLCCQ